jgi:predicted dehydrogenase
MIRLLCAGVGGMGWGDLSEAAKVRDFKIVAGADPSEEARKRFEAEMKCPSFASFPEALKQVKADAALIATPDAYHAPYSIAAMKAGLDVICEKPMAATLQDARAMCRTARQRGRLLMVHNQLRWAPAYYRARQLIDKGVIGTLRRLEFDMSVFSDVCLNGYRSKLPQLMLKDLGIHHLDLIRFLTGAACERILARSWISNEEHVSIPTTTNVYAILDMAGTITACYRSTMRCITEQTGYYCRAEITGSKGSMVVNSDGITLQTYKAFAAQKPPRKIAVGSPTRGCWADFAKAIKTRKPALTDSSDNINSMELLYAAIRSAETGALVSLHG